MGWEGKVEGGKQQKPNLPGEKKGKHIYEYISTRAHKACPCPFLPSTHLTHVPASVWFLVIPLVLFSHYLCPPPRPPFFESSAFNISLPSLPSFLESNVQEQTFLSHHVFLIVTHNNKMEDEIRPPTNRKIKTSPSARKKWKHKKGGTHRSNVDSFTRPDKNVTKQTLKQPNKHLNACAT